MELPLSGWPSNSLSAPGDLGVELFGVIGDNLIAQVTP
jgi:hypothetical protein